MKRLFAILLTTAMLCGALPAARAADGKLPRRAGYELASVRCQFEDGSYELLPFAETANGYAYADSAPGRFAGEPPAKSAAQPFSDVASGAYYEAAVVWASEAGITAGVSPTRFDPDAACTRAQVVTFLCRTMSGA